jgi:hypothetical protein
VRRRAGQCQAGPPWGVLADGGGDVAVVEVFEAGGEPFVLAVSNQAPVITSQDAGTP